MIDFLSFINKELILFTSVYVVVVLVINSIWLHPKGLAPRKEWIIELFWQCWVVRLRIIYIIFALVISGYLFGIFIELSGQFFNITDLEPEEVRNLAIAFIGTTSGLGALFGIYLAILRSNTTERQTQTAEQGLITDRITRATEGLGKNNENGNAIFEVRLGALYALERIAQDSLRDHVQIMEILCAYVRQNSPRVDKIVKPSERKPLREDIQATLTIIGRRARGINGKKRIETEYEQEYKIDLRDCDLHGANLINAHLALADMGGSNLERANFEKANLIKAHFGGANLNAAYLRSANLDNAKLYNVKLRNAHLVYAKMSGVNLNVSDLTNAVIAYASIDFAYLYSTNMNNVHMSEAYSHTCDFSQCENLTQEQLDDMFCGIGVKIPDGLMRPEHWTTKELSKANFMEAYQKWRVNRWNRPSSKTPTH